MIRLVSVLAATTVLAGCAMNGVTPAMPAAPIAAAEPAAVAPAEAAKPMRGTYGFDAAGMNTSVHPGNDFYEYANGTWAKTTAIPADKSNYGMFTLLDDLSPCRSALTSVPTELRLPLTEPSEASRGAVDAALAHAGLI